MTNCFKRDGEFFAKRQLVRPIQAEIQLIKTKVNGDDPFILLDLDLDVTTHEDLEIVAYLALWLCRFVFPSSDDVIRTTIFKIATAWFPLLLQAFTKVYLRHAAPDMTKRTSGWILMLFQVIIFMLGQRCISLGDFMLRLMRSLIVLCFDNSKVR